MYDITRRDTFDNLSQVWLREVDMYSTVPECVKLVIANKLDREGERAVTRAEGVAFARTQGCLFLEASAKTRAGVQESFEELVGRCCESPALLAASAPGGGVRLEAGSGRSLAGSCGC